MTRGAYDRRLCLPVSPRGPPLQIKRLLRSLLLQMGLGIFVIAVILAVLWLGFRWLPPL
jgi:hypothetical protein